MTRWLAAAATLVATGAGWACGHRGPPRPPLYPEPPPIHGLQVAQRGTTAILRFPSPTTVVEVGAETVEIESIEVLVYAERYPVLTPELLVAALGRERDLRLEAARAAATAAESERDREPDLQEPAEEPPPLSPEEEAMRRLPPGLAEEWRRAGVPADAVLEAARQIREVVRELWDRVEMPRAFVDPEAPAPLPEPGVVAAAAEGLLRSLRYERELAGSQFLERAATVYRIPVEELESYRVGGMIQVAHPIGLPSPAPVRTRYLFGVRSRSRRGRPSPVTSVAALAPAPVPLPPTAVAAEVAQDGVRLSWEPPPGDLWGRRIDPEELRYNVYRGPAGDLLGPSPLNPAPLAEPAYTDEAMEWGGSYTYEVRALRPATEAETAPATEEVGVGPPPRESAGARVEALEVVDRFPPEPPGDVRIVRAGERVTLQWSPSPSGDVRGFRVYRHPLPAPPLPREPRLAAGPEPPGGDPNQEPATEPAPEPNPLVEAGWELLTRTPIAATRYVDTGVPPEATYAYAVEAVDRAGNVSAPVAGQVGPEAGR